MENKEYGIPDTSGNQTPSHPDFPADLNKIETPAEPETPIKAPQSAPAAPSDAPNEMPSDAPVEAPGDSPAGTPSDAPVESPSDAPVEAPGDSPAGTPSDAPAATPSDAPVSIPRMQPRPTRPDSKYRWNYGAQQAHNKKRRPGGGVLTYAIIMTIAFCVCLVTLLGVVLVDSGALVPPITRTVFIREYDPSSGVLTVPEIIAKCRPSVVGIECRLSEVSVSEGSGIILTEDGYIATNHHVIENALSCTVVLADGREFPAEIIGSDELTDLALIKISATGLDVAEIGDSTTLIEGESVVAIGNPAGLEFAGTATTGIVSAVSRDVKIYDSTGIMTKRMTLIQTNAAVSPGNSGGALLNDRGQVIGIVNMKMTKTDYDGIGFAIPITGAMKVLNEIKATGSYSGGGAIAAKRPLIGITAGGIAEGNEYTLDDGTKGTAAISGVIVTAITPGLDAANKLQPGDIITEVDGVSVYNIYQVMDIVNNKNGGDTITVKYYRGGAYNTVTITLGTQN